MVIVLMLPLFFLSLLIAIGFFFVGYYPEAALGLFVDAWRKVRGAMKRQASLARDKAAVLALVSISAFAPGHSEAGMVEPKAARSCVIYQIRDAGSSGRNSGPFVVGCDGVRIEETRIEPGKSLKWVLIGKMGYRESLECSEHEAPSLRWTVCHDWPV